MRGPFETLSIPVIPFYPLGIPLVSAEIIACTVSNS